MSDHGGIFVVINQISVAQNLFPKGEENTMKQRSIKKLAAILMLVSFIFAAVSPAMAGGLAKITDIAGGGGASKNIGTETDPVWVASDNTKTIYFGNYWQSYSGDISTATAEQKANIANYKKEGINNCSELQY